MILGPTPWAVILGKFSDQPAKPHPVEWFRDFFVNPGTQGLFDYWRDVSYGSVTLAGSNVFDWFDLPYSLETDKKRNRWERITAAIDAVKDVRDLSPYYGIIVILNAQVDSGSVGIGQLTIGTTTKSYGLLVLDPAAWYVTYAAHEMGHSYGLDHSFDTNSVSHDSYSDSRPGAYGDWCDIMSGAGGVAKFAGAFGESGPGMNAINHEALGWLPGAVVDVDVTFGQAQRHVVLSALNQNDTSANLMARVRSAGSTSYWTVEYRRRAGWDAGMNPVRPNAVLVHECRQGLSYLLKGRTGTTDLQVGDVFEGPRFTVGVVDINDETKQATVNISTRNVQTPTTRPCDLIRQSIQAQTAVVSDLSRRLARSTVQAEIEALTQQLDEELAQLDGLYEDGHAFGCKNLPRPRLR